MMLKTPVLSNTFYTDQWHQKPYGYYINTVNINNGVTSGLNYYRLVSELSVKSANIIQFEFSQVLYFRFLNGKLRFTYINGYIVALQILFETKLFFKYVCPTVLIYTYDELLSLWSDAFSFVLLLFVVFS